VGQLVDRCRKLKAPALLAKDEFNRIPDGRFGSDCDGRDPATLRHSQMQSALRKVAIGATELPQC
jgi:hypothetical protein